MSDGKWITGLAADTPPEAAARTVLTVRLPAILPPLGPAAAGDPDPEHVHQLRVSTRRAGAALAIFRELLPTKAAKRAKRVLRAIRRAAGDARDWDVFRMDLTDIPRTDRSQPGLDYLTGFAVGRRAAAQDALAALAGEQAAKLAELIETLPGEVRPDLDRPADTFGTLARRVLGELFDGVSGRVAAGRTDAADLHQLRITGKRLRYAMEVFAGCFDPAFRELLYPAVEDLQETLGRVQDGHVAADRLTALATQLPTVVTDRSAAVRVGLQAVLRARKRQILAGERAFRTWTQRWQGLTATHPLAVLVAVQRPGMMTGGGNGSDSPAGGGSGSSRSRAGSGARTRSRGSSAPDPPRLGRT